MSHPPSLPGMIASVDGPVRVRPWRTTLGARFLLLVVLGVLLPLGVVGVWLTRSPPKNAPPQWSGKSKLR